MVAGFIIIIIIIIIIVFFFRKVLSQNYLLVQSNGLETTIHA